MEGGKYQQRAGKIIYKYNSTNTMNVQLNPAALGGASAIIAGLIMLVLGILGNMGFYTGGVEMMQQRHIFFSLSIGGIIAGTIEAIVVTFLVVYALSWLYNEFCKRFSNPHLFL